MTRAVNLRRPISIYRRFFFWIIAVNVSFINFIITKRWRDLFVFIFLLSVLGSTIPLSDLTSLFGTGICVDITCPSLSLPGLNFASTPPLISLTSLGRSGFCGQLSVLFSNHIVLLFPFHSKLFINSDIIHITFIRHIITVWITAKISTFKPAGTIPLPVKTVSVCEFLTRRVTICKSRLYVATRRVQTFALTEHDQVLCRNLQRQNTPSRRLCNQPL